MLNELSPEQYQAVEDFAKGLQECFTNKKNAPASDKLISIVMKYVLEVIDIHLQLAHLKFDRYAMQMEKNYAKV